MRYPKLAGTLVFVLCALSACGPGATTDQGSLTLSEAVYEAGQVQQRSDFVVYRDDTYPFEVQLPREWYIGDVSNGAYGIVASSTNDVSQPRALVAVVAEPIGPDF